ncbi:MAG: hypothetical protein HY074_19320 [Deltaproteobacteria bacterium]|nr:hypothetical protein [Deltaproteobacteria bacterium]
MKTETKNKIFGTAMAGILAAGLSMAKITPAFADDAPAADGDKMDKAEKASCKGKDGCKGKGSCKGKKHMKHMKKKDMKKDMPMEDKKAE